jgi:predicted  nucleic acid-binding Zn-ribbon protein
VKLDAWADDLKEGLEQEIKDLDKEIREVRKQAKLAPTLEEKLVFQRGQKKLEKKRSTARRELFEKQDEVDHKREELISEVEDRLEKSISEEELFTVQWSVK